MRGGFDSSIPDHQALPSYLWRLTSRGEHIGQEAEALLAVNPRNPELLVLLANVYAQVGEREKAHAFLGRAIDEHPREYTPLSLVGITYEILGDREKALAWIEKALSSGLPPKFLEADPWLSALRADPRYLELLPLEEPVAQ